MVSYYGGFDYRLKSRLWAVLEAQIDREGY